MSTALDLISCSDFGGTKLLYTPPDSSIPITVTGTAIMLNPMLLDRTPEGDRIAGDLTVYTIPQIKPRGKISVYGKLYTVIRTDGYMTPDFGYYYRSICERMNVDTL